MASVVANVVFRAIAVPLFGVAPDFLARSAGALASFTAVGVAAAVVVFAVIAWLSSRPVWLFQRVAVVALLLSFIPNLTLPVLSDPLPVGAREIILLMITHVIAWAISVRLLTTLTRERAS